MSSKDLLENLHGTLKRATEALERVDREYMDEQADDQEYRSRRDESSAQLRQRLMSTTDLFKGTYSAKTALAYGLGGPTPDDNDLLLRKVATAESLLRERPLTEEPFTSGVTINASALADGLKQDAERLRQALEDIKREGRELEQALVARDRAAEAWNTAYQGVADTLTGLYDLAGEEDLAERIRPTNRRRVGLPEEDDVQGENSEVVSE